MHRLIALLIVSVAATCTAAEPPQFTVTLKDHHFVPAELIVPAGQKIKLIVDNQDASAEEFESYPLNREKVVGGNARITVWIGPLKAGRYPFFGEFHADTAQGVLIAE
jgi:plastocyanin